MNEDGVVRVSTKRPLPGNALVKARTTFAAEGTTNRGAGKKLELNYNTQIFPGRFLFTAIFFRAESALISATETKIPRSGKSA